MRAYFLVVMVMGMLLAGCSGSAPPAVLPVEHDGLTILEAHWGSGTETADVRAILESQIIDGRVQLKADAVLLGDPAPNKKKTLMVVFDLKGKQTRQYFAEGTVVAFGAAVAAVNNAPVEREGLKITQATWGQGTQTLDVRKKLEDMIKGGRVEIMGERGILGDAKNPGGSILRVTFEVHGGKATTSIFREGQRVSFGVPTQALHITKATWGVGSTSVVDVTARIASLVKDGKLTMAVTSEVIGEDPLPQYDQKRLELSYTLGGKEYSERFMQGAQVEIPAPAAIAATQAGATGGAGGGAASRGTTPGRGAVATGPATKPATSQPGVVAASQPRPTARTAAVVDTQSLMKPMPLLEGFIAAESAVIRRSDEGLGVRVDGRSDGRVETLDEYKTPLVITAQMKTDNQNIRLFFGDRGMVILNWEGIPGELRLKNPRTGQDTGVQNKGSVPVNTWVTIRWTMDDKGSRLEVDGVERSMTPGNFGGLSGRVGFGQTMGSLVTLRKLEITQPAAAPVVAVATGPLKVIDAKWGAENQIQDVTAKVQALTRDGRLEMNAGVAALGDPASGIRKQLVLTYEMNGTRQTAHFEEDSDVALGAIGGTQLTVAEAAKLEAQRKLHPSGLVVVSADWGRKGVGKDVAESIRDLVSGDSLTVSVGKGMFGDGDAQTKQLRIIYDDGRGPALAMLNFGQTLQVGKNETSYLTAAGQPRSMEKLLAERSKEHPIPATGLVVLDAAWGQNAKWKDVTALCQSMVAGESLTLPALAEAYGERDAGRLCVTYRDAGEVRQVVVENGKWLQLGKQPTSFIRMEKGLQSVEKAVAEARKSQAKGLVVLDARWGYETGWKDVTALCQGMVSGDSLTVPIRTGVFQDSPFDNGRLILTYTDGQIIEKTEAGHATTLQIGPRITTIFQPKEGLKTVEKAAAEARAKYGEGLLILNASYGLGNTQVDVREWLQAHVVDGKLDTMVRDFGIKDPLVGTVKELELTFWDGTAAKTMVYHDGDYIVLEGRVPAAIRAIAALPKFVPEGGVLTHRFGVAGMYLLRAGPKGATLSADGTLSWTPGGDQMGMQEIRFSIRLEGMDYFLKQATEVVSKDVAASVDGDLSKLEKLLRLELGGEEFHYVVNPDMKGGLLLEKNRLTILGPDGTTVVRKLYLASQYFKVGERETYFVALRVKPAAIDLLDKKTGSVIRTIKLDYREVYDLALQPDKPISYVGAYLAETVPHGRIAIVDEAAGVVREPREMYGNYVAIDRSGKHLWVGLHDVHRSIAAEANMDPIFNVGGGGVRVGSMDYLLGYEVTDQGPVLKQHRGQMGENGGQVRVSPDGLRVTFLSAGGYPANTKNIAAWETADLEAKPVAYDIKDETHDQGAKNIDYHPLLPLVVMANEAGVTVSSRDSGEKEAARVKVAPGVLQGVTVKDARFSPDGLNVIVECQKGSEWFMYKVPLILNDAERATIKRGVVPAAIR